MVKIFAEEERDAVRTLRWVPNPDWGFRGGF